MDWVLAVLGVVVLLVTVLVIRTQPSLHAAAAAAAFSNSSTLQPSQRIASPASVAPHAPTVQTEPQVTPNSLRLSASSSPLISQALCEGSSPAPLNRFDMVYYINLDHRLDRRQEIEQELRLMHVDPNKLVRIAGVVAPNHQGAIGCTQAHINVLEAFLAQRELETCVIFEDDFQFLVSPQQVEQQLQAFWDAYDGKWDILMLSGWLQQTDTTIDSAQSVVWKVLKAMTTSGYAVHRRMAPTLLKNFQNGLVRLKEKYDLSSHSLDTYWIELQAKSQWYALKPLVGTQRASYSDIDNRLKEVKSKVTHAPLTEAQ